MRLGDEVLPKLRAQAHSAAADDAPSEIEMADRRIYHFEEPSGTCRSRAGTDPEAAAEAGQWDAAAGSSPRATAASTRRW